MREKICCILGTMFSLAIFMFCCPTIVYSANLSSVLGKVCVIRSAMNHNYVIDVYYGNTDNGTNIQLYQANNTLAQEFIISSAGNGYYTIVNTHSNRAIDVSGGVAGNEVNVHLWDQNGTDAQKFKFESAGNGYYYIKNKLGYYLDVYGGRCEDWTNIQTYRKNGGNNQKWLLTVKSGGITTNDGYDATLTTKIVPLGSFSTLEEWRKRMREAEGSATGFGGLVTMHETNNDYSRSVNVDKGKIIVRVDVLSYKTIKVQDPKTSGPLYEVGRNRSSIKYIDFNLPQTVKFTLHEHKFQTNNVWFNLTTLSYSTTCSCGLKFDHSWDVPYPDNIPDFSAAGIVVKPLYHERPR